MKNNIINFNNKVEDLRFRIEQRLQAPAISPSGEEMSLYDAISVLRRALRVYNNKFVKEANKLRKEINRDLIIHSIIKRDLPRLETIMPTVNEFGKSYIDFFFTDSNGRYKGQGKEFDKEKFYIDFLAPYFSKEKVENTINKYNDNFEEYFKLLNQFANDYPGVRCEWNGCYEIEKQKFDDGFLSTTLVLESINEPFVILSDVNDYEVSRCKSSRYGELYDYIEFYNKRLQKRFKVNVNDFNELYQTILRKELNLEKPKELKRVK